MTAGTTGLRRAVFLDRDGVLNRAVLRNGRPYPPARLAELDLTPGARAACQVLRRAGYLLILVTNQPDIARGKQTLESVGDMNLWLKSELGLDHLKVCPHDDADHCACRKPEPGMLLEAAREWNIDLAASFMIGDRWRDVEAGERAGCRTVFIDYAYDERRPASPGYTALSLPAAAEWIVAIASTDQVSGQVSGQEPGHKGGQERDKRDPKPGRKAGPKMDGNQTYEHHLEQATHE